MDIIEENKRIAKDMIDRINQANQLDTDADPVEPIEIDGGFQVKPCPFCRSRNIQAYGPQIICNDCNVGTGVEDTLAQAVACWNRRGETGNQEAAIEHLQNVMGHVDTPIARRRLGASTEQPEWLTGARAFLAGVGPSPDPIAHVRAEVEKVLASEITGEFFSTEVDGKPIESKGETVFVRASEMNRILGVFQRKVREAMSPGSGS